MRDKCWLRKKIMDSTLTSFKIESKDKITETIIYEMNELFPNCKRSDHPSASLQFQLITDNALGTEGFEILRKEKSLIIQGNTTKGLLYGLFRLYQEFLGGSRLDKGIRSVPDQAIRMLNHWDNFDGSVERGYAGRSIFYEDNQFRKNFDTLREYGRLLASIGINAISINNVNVHKRETYFITEIHLSDIKEIADIFQQYGISTYLSVNFAAPITIGGLKTADPVDKAVEKFWKDTARSIYSIIPDFGGFVVKADSEGEPGPFVYGRDHDDGANMLARALKPYGGLVIWRCFVYNCLQDWRDRSIDRAKAAYDNFMKLDGKFESNVILQIKNGPIDFQVREPVSPLFGALKQTNQILEFQVTQEYTGQQKHLCYLLPMWKEVLDFDTKYPVKHSFVKNILCNQSPNTKYSGVAAVVNVGIDDNWTGHKLAQANLFGYGRLIWDNQLSSETIADEWLSLTFDLDTAKQEMLADILLTSYQTYENYTAPLGIGFMVRPNHHYGPDVDGYEYDRWGTYHFADRNGIGVNRTLKDGTGYTRQYSDKRFEEYEDLAACPDELALFFHHLPYEHVLQSGKTVIQHIYDTHFEGYEKVEEYIRVWEQLKPHLDEASYQNVAERLQEQKRSARDWKDQINTYFYRKSGVPDDFNRQIYS
ncbi:alpha-glucuronidase [Enterococcus sp. CWB-B31]|uniref:alpha-glucuronidase n=1 Tax=Enterococcus sp. CWB-B31 TaxID=2885159 RepID=UPI001E3CA589|nr:alpha-glucuronidase [Enterococcus sp. CWB-B31]MCB5954216.1 alpha-glucuronidase [Enterococcus sp. CWB-B31]